MRANMHNTHPPDIPASELFDATLGARAKLVDVLATLGALAGLVVLGELGAFALAALAARPRWRVARGACQAIACARKASAQGQKVQDE